MHHIKEHKNTKFTWEILEKGKPIVRIRSQYIITSYNGDYKMVDSLSRNKAWITFSGSLPRAHCPELKFIEEIEAHCQNELLIMHIKHVEDKFIIIFWKLT